MEIESLYREHAPRLLAYLCAHLPAAVAEELHHDVWVEALSLKRELSGDHLRRWVFRVAKSKLIDYKRKASTRYEKAGLDPDRSPPTTSSGSRVLEQHELFARLLVCVEQLPEAYRVVVQGRLAGESPEEIARRLGVPRATVDTRFFKAKNRLENCVGPENT